ncbi:hypothetical protein EV361DRAFT_775783, partial [Lentinula raphanica]
YLIDKILFHAGTYEGLKHFTGMPVPDYQFWQQVAGNRLIAEQMDFNADEQHQLAVDNIDKLNQQQ